MTDPTIGWKTVFGFKTITEQNYNGVSGLDHIDQAAAKRHLKHAKKIQKWKGRMTPSRMNKIIDEIVEAQRLTMPKYRWINGMRINLHEMLA